MSAPKTAVVYLNWHKYPGDTLDTHPSVVVGAPGHDRYYPSWPLHLPKDRELQWQFDTTDPNRCIEGHYREIVDMIEAGVDVVLYDWWALPLTCADTAVWPTLHEASSLAYNEFSATALRYFLLALERAEREGRAIPRIAPFVEYHSVRGDFGAALGTDLIAKGNFTTTPADTWDVTGGFAIGTGNATYTHATGVGTLTETNAKLAVKAVASKPYKLTYTISAVTAGGLVGTLPAGLAATVTTIPLTAGTHSVSFMSGTAAATAAFVIGVTSTTGGAFTIDNINLQQLPEAYEWFNEVSLRFYSMVPERYLATIDSKILWWSWWFTQSATAEVAGNQVAPGNILEQFRSAFKAAYPTYAALYAVADMDYRDGSIGYQWWPEYTSGGLDALSEWAGYDVESTARITGQVRTAFPGFDRHAEHDGITGISPRFGTARLEYALQQALQDRSAVKLLRTMWNDFEESTWIARSLEGGDDCMATFKRYGDMLKAGVDALPTMSKPFPEWIASRPTMVGSYSLGHRWIRGRIGIYAFRTGDYVAGADARKYWGIRSQASAVYPWSIADADWLAADLGGLVTDLTATVYSDGSRLPLAGGIVCIDNEWMSYSAISSTSPPIMTISARGLYGSTRIAHTALPIATKVLKARRATVNANGFAVDMEPPIVPPWNDLPSPPQRPFTNKGVDLTVTYDLADAFTWGKQNPTMSIGLMYFDAVYRGYCLNASNPLASNGTSVTVDSNRDFPTGSGLLLIGTELIGYVGLSSTTGFSALVRGLAQTTAASHAVNAPVRQVLGRCAVLDTSIAAPGTTAFILSTGHGALVKQYDYLRVDEDATHWEIVQVLSIATDTLTVLRGVGGLNGTDVIVAGAHALTTITAGAMLHTATTVPATPTVSTITSMSHPGAYAQLQYGFLGFDGLYNIQGAYKQHATNLVPDTTVVWDRSINGATALQGAVASTGMSGSATLSADVAIGAESITISGITGFPNGGVVEITDGTNTEDVAYTGITIHTATTKTTLTGMTRGVNSTTPRAWVSGNAVALTTLSPAATMIAVDSTTGFPAKGLLLISDGTNTEYVRYGGLTAASFTDCIRGFGGYGAARAWPDITLIQRSLWQLGEWPLTDANFQSLQDYSTDISIAVKGGGSMFLMDVFALLPYDAHPNPREWGKGNKPWPPLRSAFT